MAKEDDEAPRARSSRGRSKRAKTPPPVDTTRSGGEPEHFSDPLSQSSLIRAIEAERAQLLQAHSLLKCLYETLLYADAAETTLHADVANVAARLIDESVTRLDFVRLAPMIEALGRNAPLSAAPTGDNARPEEQPNPGQPGAGYKVEDRAYPYKVEDKPPYLC